MKQLIQKIGLLLIALFVAAPAFAADYDFEVDGIYYKVISTSELTCEVVGGEGNYIVIPETVNFSNRSIKVVSIGEEAFTKHYDLISVKIPSSVTEIKNSAFHWCPSLKSIKIPNSVTRIGAGAFSYCESLASIVIPNTITEIEGGTFSFCKSIKSIKIPNSVTRIGAGAFEFCSSFTSIEIPNSVTEIGDEAFSSCKSLKSIKIPNSVTKIGSEAFSFCESLLFINLSDNLTEIEYGTFNDCKSLMVLVIPGSVRTISQYKYKSGGRSSKTFENCVNLKKIRFEYSREVLEASFYDYNEEMAIGSSWTDWTYQLEEIFIDRRLNAILVPNRLKTLTIGEHIDQVDIELEKCSGLETILCKNMVPPKISALTQKQYINIIVKVPNEALEAYQQADVWKEFWNIEGFDASGISEVQATLEKTEAGRYNLLGAPVSEDYKGIVIVRYSDGSTKKIMNK